MSENLQLHSIEINNVSYDYQIKKKRGMKGIRLRLAQDGILKISMPWYIPAKEAKKFLFKSANWIEKNFNTLNLNKNRYYYLGNEIKIIKKNIDGVNSIKYYLQEDIFYIEVTRDIIIDETKIFHEWLRKKAEFLLFYKVKEIAQKFDFQYNLVRIKDMKSRWGSCSSKKNLSFNLKLIYFKPKVIEYVIVHELCHLKEMNHSQEFWKLVENIIPNYKIYRNELKKIIL